MKCDFCSVPEVRWRYPARNFIGYAAGNIVGESVGDWAACEECHQLIESGDGDELTRHSMAKLLEAQPEIAEFVEELTAEMRGLHRRFFENRSGPPEAVVTEEHEPANR